MTVAIEHAQTIALQGLAFLAKDEELLGQFLAMSGMGPQDLKSHLNDPEVLGGVLDNIMANDHTLLDFCTETGLSPETILLARKALPGGLAFDI